ncbi:fructosamine kinase family protein [Cellulomonas bogoriensis]|uniref:Fructosamine kinase n=1 Tax=Cellulomonas bogoriensis 69B4 = DSM 16987 TaxID=1386082 RepID=A0A0A0BY07_9CELL|nr:fructosamine kinase family protein [Cellulomonas bogoriensis]KGM13243.1 fructosamine kinase [Cellulomonas bogoriensis 69B4 = DSM 16987]
MVDTFRKHDPGAPDRYYRWEAAGLRWLGQGAPPGTVAEVVHVGSHLDLVRLVPCAPDRESALALGRALATMHDAGADGFGAGPPGWEGEGYLGPLSEPLPLPLGPGRRWGAFYADLRVGHALELLAARTRVPPALVTAVQAVLEDLRAGRWDDDDTPARLHGDLWAGNVMWTEEGAVLIDPAAHGGHRLTDLAMLELFGLPHLDHVIAGYQDVHPLPDGWRDLVGLHQLHPVAVHAVLFGGGYLARLEELAHRYR